VNVVVLSLVLKAIDASAKLASNVNNDNAPAFAEWKNHMQNGGWLK